MSSPQNKSIPQQIIEKLTTRNIIALSITFTFIALVLQMTFNATALIVVLQENSEFVIAGGIVIGALIVKLSDIIQFYFRKPRSNE